ncbi:POLA2 [Symbiodinium microadriaticum]|nr:POLA2 [Symbiodinium microadriaticum]
MEPAALSCDLPVLVCTLTYLSLEDTLRCAQVRHTWRQAASQPEALVRVLHLPGDDGDSTPEGLRRLLGRGCLKHVELVEIAGGCSWFPALVGELPDLHQLRVRGACSSPCGGRPKLDVDLALSNILAVSSRLTVLDFSYDGCGSERSSRWPAMPSLARLRVQSLPLRFADLPNLFTAKDLEWLELQACPLMSSQTGIVSFGAKVQPRHLKVLRCGVQMALTLLLSVCLERLSFLYLDPPTDSRVQDELAKACAPQLGGNDPNVAGCVKGAEIWRDCADARCKRGLQSVWSPVSEPWIESACGRAPADEQVRFGPKDGRPGRREHHKFGAADRKGTYYYRFHKLIGKANWRKYTERYIAPRAVENRQRWIPTPWPTWTQSKHAHSWNWRLPKGLAAATSADEVLEVWVQFRHKHPKRTFHYFKVLKRLTDVGGCERTDWRLRFITSRLKKIHRKVLNLPRLAKYYAELKCIDEMEHVSRFLRKMLPKYTSHQLVLVAHAFAIAKLQDKHMMEEVARLVEPQLSEITPIEMVRLAQAYASTEVCHYTLLGQISAQAQVRVQQASEGQGLPGSCPSFLQLAELAEAFAHLKFQDYSFLEMASFQAAALLREGRAGPTPPALALLCRACARLKVLEVQLFEAVLAHVSEHWYDYPASCLADIGLALAPVMPTSEPVMDVYRRMLSQIRQDRDTLSLRQVGTAVRFMAEVDHKGEFMPGLAQVLARRLMDLRDETKECYDVARVAEIFSRRCPEEHALFSTLCRHLHRHLGFFEPVDFVRFARGLAAAEYRDDRVAHALPKWAEKRLREFSPHDWDSFLTSMSRLGTSTEKLSQLRESGPAPPTEPATFSGGQAARAALARSTQAEREAVAP